MGGKEAQGGKQSQSAFMRATDRQQGSESAQAMDG